MKIIKVSDTNYRAIADLTIGEFRSTGTRLPDGNWLVPIADEVWDRLATVQLPGETHDDTLTRIIRHHRGQKPN